MLIPVTMSMAILMEMMQQKVDAISQMAMQSAAAETVSVKGLLAAQMKMAKEYDIKMKELKEMNVEGKQSIIDNFRQDTGEDTRQTVTRLKTEVVEESAVAVDETKKAVLVEEYGVASREHRGHRLGYLHAPHHLEGKWSR